MNQKLNNLLDRTALLMDKGAFLLHKYRLQIVIFMCIFLYIFQLSKERELTKEVSVLKKEIMYKDLEDVKKVHKFELNFVLLDIMKKDTVDADNLSAIHDAFEKLDSINLLQVKIYK